MWTVRDTRAVERGRAGRSLLGVAPFPRLSSDHTLQIAIATAAAGYCDPPTKVAFLFHQDRADQILHSSGTPLM